MAADPVTIKVGVGTIIQGVKWIGSKFRDKPQLSTRQRAAIASDAELQAMRDDAARRLERELSRRPNDEGDAPHGRIPAFQVRVLEAEILRRNIMRGVQPGVSAPGPGPTRLPIPPDPDFGGVRLPSIWDILGSPRPARRAPRRPAPPRRRPKPPKPPRRPQRRPRPRPPPDPPVRPKPPIVRSVPGMVLRGLGGILGGILWPTEMGDTGPPPPPPPRPPVPPEPQPPRAPPPPRPEVDQEEEQRDVIGVWPEEETFPEEEPDWDNEQSPEEEDAAERELDEIEAGRRPDPASLPAPQPVPLPAPRPSLPPIVISLPSWQDLASEYLRLRERRARAPGRERAPVPEPPPSPSPASFLQPLTSSNAQRAECEARCREAARRKKRKRTDRTTCYSGTFTETRRGTRKRRKRKVPCK